MIKIKEELLLKQVYFFDPVSKNEMPSIISSINAAIIPLKKLDLFLGAIPSKIFETIAMKKPILLGVDGEAKQLFIDKGKAGIFYNPGNEKELANGIIRLAESPQLINSYGENGREFVEEKFNRDKISADFYKELNYLSKK